MSIRICAITLLTLGLSPFVYHECSDPRKVKSSMKERALASSSDRQSVSADIERSKDVQIRYEAMENAIDRESLKLNIKNLREARFSGAEESETRIWVGFGLFYPRCFIMRSINGRYEASFIAARSVGAEGEPERQEKVSITKISVGPPQSGWPQFDSLLKGLGLTNPIKLALDDKHRADPDEEMIVVEVKSSAGYSMIFFPRHTESEDGRKALEVCRKTELEFNVGMGC